MRWERLNSIMKAMDVHSWSRPDQVRVRHLDLNLDVHFDRRVLEGSVILRCDRLSGDELILDTRGLTIQAVDNCGSYELGAADPVLGAPLKIRLLDEPWVRVHYSTDPGASGFSTALRAPGRQGPDHSRHSDRHREWRGRGYPESARHRTTARTAG